MTRRSPQDRPGSGPDRLVTRNCSAFAAGWGEGPCAEGGDGHSATTEVTTPQVRRNAQDLEPPKNAAPGLIHHACSVDAKSADFSGVLHAWLRRGEASKAAWGRGVALGD